MTDKEGFALELRNISKNFSGNPVLRDVSFGILRGEVLGLLGSNGAGKSTLMKIINGVYQKDSGQILINGKTALSRDASDAQRNDIAMVYQDFSLIATLTVAQNLFLGIEPKKGPIILDRLIKRKTREILDEFGIDINPDAVLGGLSIGSQQLIEIAKTLLRRPSVLILDEPTASLTAKEIDYLFTLITRLKRNGIAIFFISHHLREVMRI
jgi:ribose transport system ATP-binding protein